MNVHSTIPRHENVVQLLGVSANFDQGLALVSEFCEGGSLLELMKKEKVLFPIEMISSFCLGISKGLAHIHSIGVIHRDLAARNVLLSETNVPKLSDFGMSRQLLGEDTQQQTKTNIGPVKWWAPENIFQLTYSSESDIWSFGVTIVEIITRQPPFPQLDNISYATALHNKTFRPRLDEIFLPFHPDLPVFAKIIESCCQFEPNKRVTAIQLVSELEKYTQSLPKQQ